MSLRARQWRRSGLIDETGGATAAASDAPPGAVLIGEAAVMCERCTNFVLVVTLALRMKQRGELG